MIKQLLNTNTGVIKKLDTNETVSAVFPGSVYSGFLSAGKMEDPFFKDNEIKALEMMNSDYEFSAKFTADDEIIAEDNIELVFDGIDTLADIFLNGVKLGYVKNMHRQWRFDVKNVVKAGENELFIHFYSPTNFIKEEYEKCTANGAWDAMIGFPHIRKAHCMFGWDWGPHLPDAGIYRDFYLEGNSTSKIENFYVTQTHETDCVKLDLQVEEKLFSDCDTIYKIEITSPTGEKICYDKTSDIVIENPLIWQPNGFGEQHLYTVAVLQYVDGKLIHTLEKRIGLRTVWVNTEKDEWGNKFAHTVNGNDIFAMGADYIPEDNILARVNYDTTYKLLKQCKDANFNCIRVWGGGYYPDDFFFDICDELGLLVWQDFMYACAVYELSEQFEENITIEMAENIKRIRHHTCLALWCGNNEMEMFMDTGLWEHSPAQKAAYIKMYEYIIPKLIKEHDPNTFYWPASPSSGGSFDEPNSPNRGDVHYWDVWHGNVPFPEYRKFGFRYLSEFGFQSFPFEKTVDTFTDDESDKNAFSYVMERHQRNAQANGKIVNYMQQTYLYPNNFNTFIYASQLLQADAVKYGVEHFRRIRGRCMGAIYWQLNDCWPVTSWASIDYCGRWKPLHYYAKRFFSPIMISCEEEGMLTQNMFVIDSRFNIKPSAKLCVANETLSDRNFTVNYALRKNTGVILSSGSEEISAKAMSSTWLEEKKYSEIDIFDTYFSYELCDGDAEISSGTVIFSVPKYFKFINPELSYEINGDELTVFAKSYARAVEILNENEDILLSDNYFDMNAGKKTVKILSGDTSKIKLRSVFDIK